MAKVEEIKLDNVAVVLPSLDPDDRMIQTVQGMIEEGFSQIVVVNDGSDEAHMAPFEAILGLPGITVLAHEVNKGKGQALKTAFRYIHDEMPEITGAVTVDGDGQHSSWDTRRCAVAMLEHPGEVIIGCRNFDSPNVPKRNAFGNKTTSWVFGHLVGMKLSDTQTGLRAIPRELFETFLETEGQRFEYEINMLLDIHEKQIPYREVPIDTIYINGNETSHFHPIKDSWKVYKPILQKAQGSRYLAGSILSTLVDLGAFSLINGLLRIADFVMAGRLGIATYGARAISSFFNYTWNRKIVFHSGEKMSKTIGRYYCIVAGRITASYLATLAISSILKPGGFGETLIKACVDLALFLLTYKLQKKWVFAEKTNDATEANK